MTCLAVGSQEQSAFSGTYQLAVPNLNLDEWFGLLPPVETTSSAITR
jgi:hypothetical protein